MGEVIAAQSANTAVNNLTSSPAAIATTLFSSVGGLLLLGGGVYFLVEHVAGDVESEMHLWWNWLTDIPGEICRSVLPDFISKHVCPADDTVQVSGTVDPTDCSVTSVTVHSRTGRSVTTGPIPATTVMNTWNFDQIDTAYGPGVEAALKTCVEGNGGVFYEKRQNSQDPDWNTYNSSCSGIKVAIQTACTPPVCPVGSMPRMTQAALKAMCVTAHLRPSDQQYFQNYLQGWINTAQRVANGVPAMVPPSLSATDLQTWFSSWRTFSVAYGQQNADDAVAALKQVSSDISDANGHGWVLPPVWSRLFIGIFYGWASKIANNDFSFKSDPMPPLPPAYQTVTVQPGDTLGHIADEVGVPWTALAAINDIPYPYVIGVGQVLKVRPLA